MIEANAHWDLDEGDLRTVFDVETSEVIAEVDAGAGEAAGRLIATAPRLLAALKSVVESTIWKHTEWCKCAICTEIRATIEQAEGREPKEQTC